MTINNRVVIVIPTYNAERTLDKVLKSIQKQTEKNEILVIDSESTDATKEILEINKITTIEIRKKDFNHGRTRQIAVEMCKNAEFIIFMTQDAVLEEKNSIETLLKMFEVSIVGCAYGRQLADTNAGFLSAHARLFNYPEKSKIKDIQDARKLGIKAVFNSNSFAAYRMHALKEVGGFPLNVILSEDTYVAAKMLINGWKIAYCAEAKVYHSHNYTMWQEFKRYFDIGVFHAREPWIREKFGNAEGEGKKFLLSELSYIIKHNVFLLPRCLAGNIFKYFGYKLGLKEKMFHKSIKMNLSMCKFYWN